MLLMHATDQNHDIETVGDAVSMTQSEASLNAYDAAYERIRASGKRAHEAAFAVVEDYLDGKPRLRGKKKVSKAERDEAFWSSAFADALPSEKWRIEPFTLALVRYFSQDRVANLGLLSRIAQTFPDALCYAVRRSGLVLRPGSPRRAELSEIGGFAPEIAELCRILKIFETAYYERIAALEVSRARLASLTPFELLIYASLYAFQILVPNRMGFRAPSEDDEQPTEQEFWDALNELLTWKLATVPEAALTVTQNDVAASIAAHLSPMLFPSRTGGLPQRDLWITFVQVVADQIELSEFISRSADAFSYEDAIRFVRRGDALKIEEVDPTLRAAWFKDGRKLDRLHGYWLHRAMDAFAESDIAERIIGSPENHEANQVAYIHAMRTHLRLTEVYGVDETVSADTGERADLFTALLSLELMSAFFLRDFLHVFAAHFRETGDSLVALSRLAFRGIAEGLQNRFPLTWSDRTEKIAKIVGWTVSSEMPQGSPRMAAAILDLWSSDWAMLGRRLREGVGGLQPELFERPVLRLGQVLVQLPWVVGVQNNSSAAINNLRRLGARRGEARDETRRIEERLGRLFASRGFRTAVNWHPPIVGPDNPGEVDLICARDNAVLVLELKSTYLRRSPRDAWLHATTTLRKAGKQLRRKVVAIEQALSESVELANALGLEGRVEPPTIHGWIVDTSIECDHQRFEGFLKVSLEEVLIALRDDAHFLDDLDGLLSGQYRECVLEEARTAEHATLYHHGFSASRFLEVIDSEEVWKERKPSESSLH